MRGSKAVIPEVAQLAARLQAAHVRHVIHEHAPVRTMADVLAKLPFPRERTLKTLVIIADDVATLVVLRGLDRVDFALLSRALTTPRARLRSATEREVRTMLGGVEPGAVGPLSAPPGTQIIVDTHVAGLGDIFCGVGSRRSTLQIDADDLIRLSGATLSSVSAPPKTDVPA